MLVTPQSPFAELFREHGPHVGRALRNLGVGEADLPDALRETFLDVHRRLPGFRGESSLRTWIYGIALRVAPVHRKTSSERTAIVPEEPLPVSARSPSPQELAERRQELARLDAAMDGLDEDERAVFVLYEVEELTLAEIAIAVGKSVPTIYSRLKDARNVVLTAFRPAGPTAERDSGS